MDTRTHWEKLYSTKNPDQMSWYRAHLERSVALIQRAASDLSAAIADVGGGESTLVDDLLLLGYRDITVLDISETAINVSKTRLNRAAERVHWLIADITATELESTTYDVWHDRAVFHFLTTPSQRAAYVRNVARAIKRGGHVIVSTFGPEVRSNVAVLMSCAMTQIACTMSSVHISG